MLKHNCRLKTSECNARISVICNVDIRNSLEMSVSWLSAIKQRIHMLNIVIDCTVHYCTVQYCTTALRSRVAVYSWNLRFSSVRNPTWSRDRQNVLVCVTFSSSYHPYPISLNIQDFSHTFSWTVHFLYNVNELYIEGTHTEC